MKLNQGRRVSISNGFNRTLLHNELNRRKLFNDVDTFDDLYNRHSEDHTVNDKPVITKQILRKTVKLQVLEYSLENCFKVIDENLRIIYNKIKNFIMSYQDFNYLYSQDDETFLHNNDEIVYLTIKNDYIILSHNLTNNTIKYYINNEKDFDRMIEEISVLFNDQFIKINTYVEIDYLKNYPHCEKCVIMNDDIIDNPPFKEILKK